MPDSGRSLIIVLLLAFAVLSTWAIWFRDRSPPEVVELATRSDYVLRDFELRSYDPEGRPEYRIRSPYLEREPGLESLQITTPVMLMFDATGSYWRMTSESAWISGDNEQLQLRGAVRVQGPVENGEAARMLSSNLVVWPRQDLIEGSEDVLLTRPGTRLRGTGMRVQLSQRVFEILDRVHARYDAHVEP